MGKKFYNDLSQKEWDELVSNIPTHSFFTSWSYINYLSKLDPSANNLSYIEFNNNVPIFAAALGITQKNPTASASFSNNPCIITDIASTSYSFLKKTAHSFHTFIEDISSEYSISKLLLMSYSPLFHFHCINHSNPFCLSLFGYNPAIKNTLFVPLERQEDDIINDMSKYHRRNIKRSEKLNLDLSCFDFNCQPKDIYNEVMNLKKLHIQCAGRQTRNDLTWEAMITAIINDSASLFSVSFEEDILGYLLCGHGNKLAVGWSQANDKRFESKFNIRHLLEWYAY